MRYLTNLIVCYYDFFERSNSIGQTGSQNDRLEAFTFVLETSHCEVKFFEYFSCLTFQYLPVHLSVSSGEGKLQLSCLVE